MRKVTAQVLWAIAGLLIVYDISAYSITGSRATISDVMLSWSMSKPGLPFAYGALAGHLFWPEPFPGRSGKAKIAGLAALLAIAGGLSFLSLPAYGPVILMIVGIPAGRFLWPQTALEKLPSA